VYSNGRVYSVPEKDVVELNVAVVGVVLDGPKLENRR
jgi:hypothetical protein